MQFELIENRRERARRYLRRSGAALWSLFLFLFDGTKPDFIDRGLDTDPLFNSERNPLLHGLVWFVLRWFVIVGLISFALAIVAMIEAYAALA